MHAFDRQTDGQTDGRTDRRTEISSLRPRCILCSAVKTMIKTIIYTLMGNCAEVGALFTTVSSIRVSRVSRVGRVGRVSRVSRVRVTLTVTVKA